MAKDDLLKADQNCGRGWLYSWPRPLFLWMIVFCIPFALLMPDVSIEKFRILVGAGIFLAIFRGMIDKDGLARMLSVWKGKADAG